MSGTISTEQALIYVMVMMTGVEGRVKQEEMAEMELLIRTLPAFQRFDRSRLATVVQECGDMLQEKEGLKAVLGLVKDQLPARLRETARTAGVDPFRRACRHMARQFRPALCAWLDVLSRDQRRDR